MKNKNLDVKREQHIVILSTCNSHIYIYEYLSMTSYGFVIFVFNDLMSNGYRLLNLEIFWKMAKEIEKILYSNNAELYSRVIS